MAQMSSYRELRTTQKDILSRRCRPKILNCTGSAFPDSTSDKQSTASDKGETGKRENSSRTGVGSQDTSPGLPPSRTPSVARGENHHAMTEVVSRDSYHCKPFKPNTTRAPTPQCNTFIPCRFKSRKSRSICGTGNYSRRGRGPVRATGVSVGRLCVPGGTGRTGGPGCVVWTGVPENDGKGAMEKPGIGRARYRPGLDLESRPGFGPG